MEAWWLYEIVEVLTCKETSCFLRRASAPLSEAPEHENANFGCRARKMTSLLHGFAPSALRIFPPWRPFLLAIALFSCLVRASVASAQAPTWASIGPDGGDVVALAIDPATPTTLYAGTDGGGAFKTTNAGDN